MDAKEEFIEIYKTYIKRSGSQEFLDFLLSTQSDFFIAPASTRFHGAHKGGLVEHSVNVFHCLKDYLSRNRVQNVYGMEYDDETIAIVSLLHDVCKINVYKESIRNKKVDGQWVQAPYFEFDDKMPYGHGEKSVYMITSFMKLSREEAFAIRYHMGFANGDPVNNVGYSFEHFPLSFALSTADMEATYFCEGE